MNLFYGIFVTVMMFVFSYLMAYGLHSTGLNVSGDFFRTVAICLSGASVAQLTRMYQRIERLETAEKIRNG